MSDPAMSRTKRPASSVRGAVPRLRDDRELGGRHVILVVLDSLRFDSMAAARRRLALRLGPLQRRWSYATWTGPAHYNLLMGLLPHDAGPGCFAAAWHGAELSAWGRRLGRDDLGLPALGPALWLPSALRERCGYFTQAFVSMPALNPAVPLAVGFDRYVSMPRHNDVHAIYGALSFPEDRPSFTLINTGETHYPYATAEEPPGGWPRLPGVHGVFGRLANGQPLTEAEAPSFFSPPHLRELQARQVRAASAMDDALEHLFDRCPRGAHIILTSDHGELFGEDGFFGHGPIHHEKVLEVPFVEGLLD